MTSARSVSRLEAVPVWFHVEPPCPDRVVVIAGWRQGVARMVYPRDMPPSVGSTTHALPLRS